VSPVFRHGRLRLYLLKLLDESPRHGYEVIRLLQDRFLGVYAPSPGTIYPRLARLEEDGLVTHEEVNGRKVYSITDKGREEIRNRLSDLTDLEDELTESLHDVAREISEDVRQTVRGIREDLVSAFRSQREGRPGQGGPTGWAGATGGPAAETTAAGADDVAQGAGPGSASGTTSGSAADRADQAASTGDDARRIRDEARRTREEMRAKFRARNRGDWAGWDWAGRSPWADWAGAGCSDAAAEEGAQAGRDRPGRGGAGPFSDLERLAIQFATELRNAARQAGDVGERSLNDLRDILSDALARVKDEVFAQDTGPGAQRDPAGPGDQHETE
jgi:DNA-binding PadR family transcriptional regulator